MLSLNNSCDRVKVGITMGDPSGIGPEIIAKALKKNWASKRVDFVIIGDMWVFSRLAKISSFLSGIKFIDLKNVPHNNFSFGRIRANYGRASIEYLDRALKLMNDNIIDCVVTCPISKESVGLAGYKLWGHTEYFKRMTGAKEAVMMLLNNRLKISLVTRHIPLKSVSINLNQHKIFQTVFLTIESLKHLFSIKKPRIAVCGLNPHASDNGLIGSEENKIIKPAVKKIRSVFKLRIDGPIPADVAILKAQEKDYDCVIAMYHDQALIPLKSSAEEKGVNITLGLPFIRTSPLHGTAFDIAGRNLANPISLTESIRLAVKCTLNLRKA